MSWQSYVDSNLLGGGVISNAAIIGQKGGVYASSPGFIISLDEQKKILQLFQDPTSVLSFKVAGVKYFVEQAHGYCIYGKVVGASGVVLAKTKQAILIAVYDGTSSGPDATVVVEKLADYLIGVGY